MHLPLQIGILIRHFCHLGADRHCPESIRADILAWVREKLLVNTQTFLDLFYNYDDKVVNNLDDPDVFSDMLELLFVCSKMKVAEGIEDVKPCLAADIRSMALDALDKVVYFFHLLLAGGSSSKQGKGKVAPSSVVHPWQRRANEIESLLLVLQKAELHCRQNAQIEGAVKMLVEKLKVDSVGPSSQMVGQQVARFLFDNSHLFDPNKIGHFLSKSRSLILDEREYAELRLAYARLFNFIHLPVDRAVRVYLGSGKFSLPTKLERALKLLEPFAATYFLQCPAAFER